MVSALLRALAAPPLPPAKDINTYQPAAEAGQLLGYLAWGASAAGVLGLIIVGTQLSLQLRRGEMGEGATYFRGFFIVVGSCVVAATAGPVVGFLPLGS